jgi:hypothetical protein
MTETDILMTETDNRSKIDFSTDQSFESFDSMMDDIHADAYLLLIISTFECYVSPGTNHRVASLPFYYPSIHRTHHHRQALLWLQAQRSVTVIYLIHHG